MAASGNAGQWGNSFPPEAMLREDICRQQLYVLEDRGRVHGVFVFVIGEDSSYSVIEGGTWLSDSPYGTIHRVASDGEVRGVFREIVTFCEARMHHLRIDTHENNRVMQYLIEKNGFQKCGVIYVEDGTPRLAYEKL